MAKARPWPRHLIAKSFECAKGSVPSKAAQGDDRTAALKQHQLSLEIREASISLVRGRTVCGRRAAHYGGHVGVMQEKPVVPMGARGLVRKAGTMQGGIEPVAGAITGEYAASAIGTVSSRREANYGHPPIRVAKAIQRSGPVVLSPMATRGVGGALLAPLDQARALPATVDLCGQVAEPR